MDYIMPRWFSFYVLDIRPSIAEPSLSVGDRRWRNLSLCWQTWLTSSPTELPHLKPLAKTPPGPNLNMESTSSFNISSTTLLNIQIATQVVLTIPTSSASTPAQRETAAPTLPASTSTAKPYDGHLDPVAVTPMVLAAIVAPVAVLLLCAFACFCGPGSKRVWSPKRKKTGSTFLSTTPQFSWEGRKSMPGPMEIGTNSTRQGGVSDGIPSVWSV